MPVFDSLVSLIRSKRPRAVYYVVSENDPRVVDLDLAAIYRTQSNLQSVVGFIADNIAQLPIKVYELGEDDSHDRVRDSAAAQLFLRPNDFMTCFELVRNWAINMCVYGRILWVIVPDESAPSGWQILPIPNGWIARYEGTNPFRPDAVYIRPRDGIDMVRVPSDSFVLFHTFDPTDPAKALSPVTALRSTLTEQVEAERYRKQVWKRGGRMSSYVTRPKDVKPFSPQQRAQFIESFRAAWTSDLGSDAGGTILLEDGMEIKNIQFSAREAQWAEAKKFSREDCAGIYHIDPGLIWPGEGQSYASAKDNARKLYSDSFGPMIVQFEQRCSQFMLPMLGESGRYIELDFDKKLRGNFEEQAQVIQTLVGRPVLSANEGRRRLNYPDKEGEEYDEVITPLNVTAGGQASPTDSSPKKPENAPASLQSHGGPAETKDGDGPRRVRGTPAPGAATALAETFGRFYARQRKAVVPRIGAAKAANTLTKADGDDPDWWDSERWDRELADDLNALALAQTTEAAKAALKALGIELDYDEDRTKAFVRSMCQRRAEAINRATRNRIMRALALAESDEATEAAEEVFEDAEEKRAEGNGNAFAAALAGWALIESMRQAKRDPRYRDLEPTKTWIHNHSDHPRPEHQRMNGETVPYDARFSNGAEWPGDTGALNANEIVNCRCEVEITIP